MSYWVSEIMAWVLGVLGGTLVAWPFFRLWHLHHKTKVRTSGKKLVLAYLTSALIFTAVYLVLFKIDRYFLEGPFYDSVHIHLGNFLFGGTIFICTAPVAAVVRFWNVPSGVKKLLLVFLAILVLFFSALLLFILAVKFSGPTIFWSYN